MNKHIKLFTLPLFIGLALLNTTSAETTSLDSAVETKLLAQKDVVISQNKVDALVSKTDEMVQKYRDAIRKTDSLNTYNGQISRLVRQQKVALNAIKRQLDNVEETQRDIIPFMVRMIYTLEKFVELDLPFLTQERQTRVAGLKTIMDSPDVSLPEKYRRIMEAYQIEMEYGRTLETYSDTVKLENQEFTVDILRVGRLLISFQTLDGKMSGVWNRKSKSWEKVSSEYKRSIKQGLQIAKKQAPPELIKLPINMSEKE